MLLFGFGAAVLAALLVAGKRTAPQGAAPSVAAVIAQWLAQVDRCAEERRAGEEETTRLRGDLAWSRVGTGPGVELWSGAEGATPKPLPLAVRAVTRGAVHQGAGCAFAIVAQSPAALASANLGARWIKVRPVEIPKPQVPGQEAPKATQPKAQTAKPAGKPAQKPAANTLAAQQAAVRAADLAMTALGVKPEVAKGASGAIAAAARAAAEAAAGKNVKPTNALTTLIPGVTATTAVLAKAAPTVRGAGEDDVGCGGNCEERTHAF